MSVDPVAVYQEAVGVAVQAAQKLQDMVHVIARVGHEEEAWPYFQLDQKGDLIAPGGHPGSISLQHWPSAEGLRAAVKAWTTAVERVEQAWRALPPTRQVALIPPDVVRVRAPRIADQR